MENIYIYASIDKHGGRQYFINYEIIDQGTKLASNHIKATQPWWMGAGNTLRKDVNEKDNR